MYITTVKINKNTFLQNLTTYFIFPHLKLTHQVLRDNFRLAKIKLAAFSALAHYSKIIGDVNGY